MVGCEVKEENASDSDASSATDANEYMAAADMQVMHCQQDRFNFTQSLINLVSSPPSRLSSLMLVAQSKEKLSLL